MENSRQSHSACSYGTSHIIVTGGFRTKTVEKYNIIENNWVKMPNLSAVRYFHVSCIMGNVIYVFGGIDTRLNDVPDSVE